MLTVAVDNPEKAAREMTGVFKRPGVKSVRTFAVSSREDAESKRGIKLIEEAAAVFFTGGDLI